MSGTLMNQINENRTLKFF